MLTQAIEVMKYVRASAGRAGLNVQFEDINQPRHDGKTIYLPRITTNTSEQDLAQLMASTDHEVAHDRFSDFGLLRETKLPPKSLNLFVWNCLEDSRVNNIEATEYTGFRQNWDNTTGTVVENILKHSIPQKEFVPRLFCALICWECEISKHHFPLLASLANGYKPDEEISRVLAPFGARLRATHDILDKRKGSQATHELSVDILKALSEDEKVKEELEKLGAEQEAEQEAEADTEGDKEEGEGAGKPGIKAGDAGKKQEDDGIYRLLKVEMTEEQLSAGTVTTIHDKPVLSAKTNTGVHFDPVNLYGPCVWDMTDPQKFIVVDYPKNTTTGKDHLQSLLKANKHYDFTSEFRRITGEHRVVTDNFVQQVRRLIQIRARVQTQYGVKRGKLDQSRLSRVCFDAPGFNERIFKRRIDNKTLDAAVQVLVDMSGSMGGVKAHYACAAAMMMIEVCHTLRIPLEILGFTDEGPLPLMYIYKSFNDPNISTEVFLDYFNKSVQHMSGNPDGENILWASNRLLHRKERKRVLIVMSDGSPAASRGASGIEAFTKKVIKEIENSKKIDIYGLGLCSSSVNSYYKNRSVVNIPEEIPQRLLQLFEERILND